MAVWARYESLRLGWNLPPLDFTCQLTPGTSLWRGGIYSWLYQDDCHLRYDTFQFYSKYTEYQQWLDRKPI